MLAQRTRRVACVCRCSTYRSAGNLVDGVGGIDEVGVEERLSGRGEVGGLWVAQKVDEGLDDGLGLRVAEAEEDRGWREHRLRGAPLFEGHGGGESASREGKGGEDG